MEPSESGNLPERAIREGNLGELGGDLLQLASLLDRHLVIS